MRVCNHKNRINIMLCLLNSTVVDPRLQTRRAMGQLAYMTSSPFWYEIEAEEIILNIDNHRLSH